MKHIKQLLALAAALLLPCQLASAYDFEVDGIYYNIKSESKHTVSTTSETIDDYTSYVNVTIPETVQYNGAEYTVTEIGKGTFHRCSKLSSVTLPNTVTNIGYMAFEGCSSLSSINIPSNLTSIGVAAFKKCLQLTSFVIPQGVTYIETDTFYDCSSLTSVIIPNSVKSIKDHAFLY